MPTPDPNLTLTVVFESTDPVAINVARAALQEAGIEFAVVEEALQGYGFSPMLNPVSRIQVAEDSEEMARKVIEEVSTSTNALSDESKLPDQ